VAYHARAQTIDPATAFFEMVDFSTEFAVLIVTLFGLEDAPQASETLNILGTDRLLKGFPKFTEAQKVFAQRWMESVLSPPSTDITLLRVTEQDGFGLIPEIVSRAKDLWEEYIRHAFGKVDGADVIFMPKKS
jgi:hypothetical protein